MAQHSDRLLGPRQVGARSTFRPQPPVEAQHSQRRIGRAERDRSEGLRGRIVERPVDNNRAAAHEHVGAHESERAAAQPLGRAGDCADEAFGRFAPARLVGQMPEADENFGEKPDT